MNGRLADDCFALPPGVDWTPVEVALARLREGLRPVTGIETVGLSEAAGRVLAEPVLARRDSPPAANAAVDGYAFAWEAAGAEADLPLAEGRAAAGHPWPGHLPAGEALRILTGAELPAGADTVVLEEDCRLADGRVRFPRPRKPGANRRPQGEDARHGEPVLAAGRRLRPQDLARAASVGADRLAVRQRLRVGILSTGDELLAPGTDPAQPGIFDANRPMLAALAAGWGAEVVDLGAAGDDAGAVRAALDGGAASADVLLTSGGASAGDEDHLSRLLGREGRRETWRIAVKPGRPLAMGLWQGRPVFCLPGNPVAAFVCTLIFARPALAVLAGADWPEPLAFTVPAAFAKRKKRGRREYLRARLDAAGHAEVFASEGSGRVGGLSWSEGLVELPDAGMDIAPGDPVRYLPYAGFGI
ncbi:molybdopterin-binding protein [Paralimibaculum aggregatum]|uniref:Molybdopterin molybdenumtransferase n=1 Tax=Paralimibaculum aggregatum TaxID=3036245 RepID=A0ABQ6LJM6_9RHOB|nr:gephyrin-like molybdotransferase Glp [Limibaculum sp. NKW23]GMG83461.1 molybdopterin-binding protein [Limibaculum sp. NKW23]